MNAAAFLTRFSSVFGFFKECETEDAGEYCVGNQLVYRCVNEHGCSFGYLNGELDMWI